MISARSAANVLRAIGMHPKYKGYGYLLCMLEATMNEPRSVYRVSSELYPMVMSKFGVSRTAAERCIRFAIKRTWENGNQDSIRELFGAYETGLVPTNNEFIAIMTECMCCRRVHR